MNVKTNSKGYPKALLREKSENRGDTYSMKTTVDGMDFYASVHRDKQPMYLVHTAESMLPGPTRKRNFVMYDKKTQRVVRRRYTLEQP